MKFTKSDLVKTTVQYYRQYLSGQFAVIKREVSDRKYFLILAKCVIEKKRINRHGSMGSGWIKLMTIGSEIRLTTCCTTGPGIWTFHELTLSLLAATSVIC